MIEKIVRQKLPKETIQNEKAPSKQTDRQTNPGVCVGQMFLDTGSVLECV